MRYLLLLFGIGEFLETNPGVVLTVVGSILSLAAWGIRLEYLARITRADLDETMDDVSKHVANSDAHVNQLYIGTLKDRIAGVETDIKGLRTEMVSGHKEIVDKIDSKFDTLTARLTK